MQKINILLFVLVAWLFSGCSNNKSSVIKTDSLAYSYQTIKERQVDCDNKPDRECILVQVKYPVFKTNKTLNDSIQHTIINHGLEADVFHSDSSTNLQLSAKNYGDEFRKLIKHPDPGLAIDYINLSVDVIKQDSGFISINLLNNGYHYPITKDTNTTAFSYFSNWNTKTNSKIFLNDILIDNYETRLNQIAEKIFRKQEGLSDTVSFNQFADDGSGKRKKLTDPYNQRHFYKFDKFTVIDGRFLITRTGLKFRYNPFDIKPFGTGITDLFIPYQSIKQLLRPNTVISQYIK